MAEVAAAAPKPLDRLTRWVRWILYAQLLLAPVALISGALEYQVLTEFQEGYYETQEAAVAAGESSDARQGLIGIVQLLLLLASAILVLTWFHRANHNARQLGAQGMVYTPGWAVGWFFVPFANFWKPYQVMKEIWQVSAAPGDWTAQAVPWVLPVWWISWIASSLIGNAAFRLSLRAEELDQLMSANAVTQLSEVVGIPGTIALIWIVGRVRSMQARQAASGGVEMPPPAAPSGEAGGSIASG